MATLLLGLASFNANANADAAAEMSMQQQWSLSIQREPLSVSLKDLAKQLSIQIAQFSDPEYAGVMVGPLYGTYSRQQALELALQGSGLTYRFINDHTVVILRRASSPEVSDSTQTSSSQATDESIDCSSSDASSDGRVDAGAQGSAPRGPWSRLLNLFGRRGQGATLNPVVAPPNATTACEPSKEKAEPDSNRKTRCWFGVFCAAATPLSGVAQTSTVEESAQLEEVVVTAERRSADIQKTAVSVSVRTGEELAFEGKYTLANILEDVPGIQGSQSRPPNGSGSDTSGGRLVFRGIPSNIGVPNTASSVASSAAVYVDGVYEGVGGSYDIDRVEVLRGPQGTLYGRSATSGLVSIRTRNPQLGEFGGYASTEVGNFDLLHYRAAVNVPFSDTLALRVSADKYSQDGFFFKNGNSLHNRNYRAKLLFAPGENFSMLLGVAAQDNKTYGEGGSIYITSTDEDYRYVPNGTANDPNHNKYRQAWAELNWNLDFGKLSYMPALRTWKSEALTQTRFAPPAGSFDTYATTDKDDFWTHELHLNSNEDSKVAWQVGALYYNNDLHNNTAIIRQPSLALGNSQDIARETTAESAFAEATYPFDSGWSVTAGLRFDHTEVAVEEAYINNVQCSAPGSVVTSPTYCLPENLVTGVLTGDDGKATYSNWTYKLRVERNIRPGNLVYAMVSTGASPGDVTMTADLRPTVNGVSNPRYGYPVRKDIESETLTAYEIGSKNRFLDNRLQLNGSAFFYDYGAYQVATNVNGTVNAQGIFIPISAAIAPPQYDVLSAPVRAYGVELETLYQLTPRARIALTYSYTNAYFTDKSKPVSGTSATFADFFGYDRVPNLVPQRASLSYGHTFDLPGGSSLTVQPATRWISRHKDTAAIATSAAMLANGAFMSLYGPLINVESQFISDLSLSWNSPTGMFTVTAWSRNVFDNQYRTSPNLGGINVATVTGASTISPTGVTVAPYDPRTYGVNLNVKW